jgi:cyclopropane fatty-acyl-phospholipid synthase-like methyltransferase
MLDTVAYFHIAYARHAIMNPLRADRLVALARRCIPSALPRVLDIGSGLGHASLALAAELDAYCVQVDSSPLWTARAEELFARHGMAQRTLILTRDAAAYHPPEASFDAILCLGTAPIYGGLADALAALSPALRPGGVMIVGEPTIDLPLPRRYKTYIDNQEWAILSSGELLTVAENAGFELLECHRSTAEEWDEYMSLQWAAILDHARAHPGNSEAQEFAEWARDEQEVYLTYQRHYLDWNVIALRERR